MCPAMKKGEAPENLPSHFLMNAFLGAKELFLEPKN
jgi:hypothetical protein